MKCPDCGGTYVRCTHCGTQFSTAQGPALVKDILRQADAPLFGTTLAELAGYSVPGMYNMLARMIVAGEVEKVGMGKQRKDYRLVRIIQFRQPVPQAQKAAA